MQDLRPLTTWSAAIDSNLSAPIDIDAVGCRVAVADFNTKLLLIKDGPGPWRVIGRQGGGPGEYERPGRVALLPGGGIVVLDQARQRLVLFGPDGSSIGPPIPRAIPYQHPTGGKLVAIDDSTLADYEFAARIPWRPIPEAALESIPLVVRFHVGRGIQGGWGHPVASDKDDPTDVWRINAGALAVDGDKLLVLRRSSGVLEEYGIADGALKRSDTLDLLMPAGSGGTDGVAGSIAVLGDGRIVAVLRGPTDLEASGNIFLPEWTIVLDGERREVARYKLTTRLTHLAAGGGAILFAMGSAGPGREEEGDPVIDLLRIPGTDSTDRCGWSR